MTNPRKLREQSTPRPSGGERQAAHGCFDDEAEAQLLLSSHRGLHLTHQGIGHVDVLKP